MFFALKQNQPIQNRTRAAQPLKFKVGAAAATVAVKFQIYSSFSTYFSSFTLNCDASGCQKVSFGRFRSLTTIWHRLTSPLEQNDSLIRSAMDVAAILRDPIYTLEKVVIFSFSLSFFQEERNGAMRRHI